MQCCDGASTLAILEPRSACASPCCTRHECFDVLCEVCDGGWEGTHGVDVFELALFQDGEDVGGEVFCDGEDATVADRCIGTEESWKL